MTTDELLHVACPTINTLGAAFYFAPEALEMGKERGLDGFRLYFIGRGGVLGDVEAPVVASAFGYFEASLVDHIWSSAKEIVAPREGGRLYREAAWRFGRAHFADLQGLDEFCAAAEAVVAAADPAGLALFAGVAAEPRPDDAPARAMQLLAILRELRGSAHLLAVVASGLSPRVAHYMRRPDFYATFGWPEDQPPAVTEDDRVRQKAADDLTDRLMRAPFGVLDEAGRQGLMTGLRGMEAALAPASS